MLLEEKLINFKINTRIPLSIVNDKAVKNFPLSVTHTLVGWVLKGLTQVLDFFPKLKLYLFMLKSEVSLTKEFNQSQTCSSSHDSIFHPS